MSQIKLKHSGGNSVIIAAPDSNPASDVTLKLPQADGSAGQFMKTDGSGNLSFGAVSAGILNVHQFRLSSSLAQSGNGTDNDLTENWEKVDDAAAGGTIGSFSDPSSGIYTFPSTGIWRVDFNSRHYSSDSRYAGHRVKATTDGGSNYDELAQVYSLISGGYIICLHSVVIMDVTNVSTHKIKFVVFGDGSNVSHSGSSNTNLTYATFIRLGDT